MDGGDPRQQLAQRLRALREERWPDKKITQPKLARALGGVSVSLISSWESLKRKSIPPQERLDAYALVFATARSFRGDEPRQLSAASLTAPERLVMDELRKELRGLRNAALAAGSPQEAGDLSAPNSTRAGPWHFEDGKPVRIVCARLPQEMLDKIPYTRVDDPDYIELLTFSELDSLFEIYGHLRAENRFSSVYRRNAGLLAADDYQSHLVVLGGVDWNSVTRTVMQRLQLPVRQVADWGTDGAQYFEVQDNGVVTQHRPVLRRSGDVDILEEDVALFARSVNPFNRDCTVTICSGMYGRGTYGVVRALTDEAFRDRNAEYLRSRFRDCTSYLILSRIPIVDGSTLTPDWTIGAQTLFEWSK